MWRTRPFSATAAVSNGPSSTGTNPPSVFTKVWARGLSGSGRSIVWPARRCRRWRNRAASSQLPAASGSEAGSWKLEAGSQRLRSHLLVIRQAALRHRHLAVGAGVLLLDQVVLDAADRLCRLEDSLPRHVALAERDRVAVGLAPVFQVNALDPARVGLDPGDGVRACLDRRAGIELEHDLLWRVRGQDVHRTFAVLERLPLGLMVMESGRHVAGAQLLARRGKLVGKRFPPVRAARPPRSEERRVGEECRSRGWP